MREFYQKLYSQLNEITPLQVDCGELCQSACCSLEVGEGIYLFPEEECMFTPQPDWGKIKISNEMKIIECNGHCRRDERPLFCRIFPLFPYIDHTGEMKIIFYSPMNFICPLIKLGEFEMLAPDYLEEVAEISNELAKHPITRPFLEKISREIDEFRKEPWANLFEK